MRSISLAAALVALAALAASPAGAAPTGRTSPPPTATATLEVTESSATGTTSTTAFETAITLDHGTATLAASAGTTRYEISTAWNSTPGAQLLDVSFQQHREGQVPTRLSLRTRVPRNQRTPLATVTRPDGTRLTIAITLR
jgi:hypothetical protein